MKTIQVPHTTVTDDLGRTIIRINRMIEVAFDQLDKITHPDLHQRIALRSDKARLIDKMKADLYAAEQRLWLYAKETKELQESAQLLLKAKSRKRTRKARHGINATRRLAAQHTYRWTAFTISDDTLEPYTKEERNRFLHVKLTLQD